MGKSTVAIFNSDAKLPEVTVCCSFSRPYEGPYERLESAEIYLIREKKNTQSSRVELRCEVDNQVLIVIDDALRTEVDEQALMADSLVKWTCFGTSG